MKEGWESLHCLCYILDDGILLSKVRLVDWVSIFPVVKQTKESPSDFGTRASFGLGFGLLRLTPQRRPVVVLSTDI